MTSRETVRLLGQSLINRLENQKWIDFAPMNRQKVRDEVYAVLSPMILTEEDLRTRTLEKMGSSSEALSEHAFAESDQYRTAKAMVRETFGDDEQKGLFFQRNLRQISHALRDYLMSSRLIEDVFASDDELEKLTIETIQKFDPNQRV